LNEFSGLGHLGRGESFRFGWNVLHTFLSCLNFGCIGPMEMAMPCGFSLFFALAGVQGTEPLWWSKASPSG
jgi:hypothetical protein